MASTKKLKPEYISRLFSELYDTLSSGMSINDGIYMLIEEGDKDPVLEILLKETSKGGTFSNAVKRTNAFPAYVEEMIAIGEHTGRLDSVMRELSIYYARQDEITQNIKNAVTFPLILLAILVVIVVLLLTQVMPVFNDVFKQIGITMSASAITLMNLGNLMREYAVYIIIGVVVIIGLILLLYKLPATHNKVLAVVQGKKLKKQMSASKFASAMSMTMSSGMDIDESLEMSKKLCDEDSIKKINSCQKLMRDGVGFDKAIQKSAILDSINSSKLSISFHTGKTDETMRKIADDYAEKVNTSVDEKISRVEPALVIIMSLLVGFVLFSVMVPLLSVITAM